MTDQTITATFEGIALSSFNFSLTPGVVAGMGTIVIPDTTVAIPKVGTAIISDGTNIVILEQLYTTAPRAIYDAISGVSYSVTISDRRFTWTGGYIVGEYNKPEKDGTPTKTVTLEDLICKCFVALEEYQFSCSDIPDAFPYVKWNFDNPASALQSLCDKFGLEVGYDIDNTIVVCPKFYARTLPYSPYSSAEDSINNDILPRKVILVGARKVVQSEYADLVAVGEDTDGTIKPIDSLSYKPSHSWGTELVACFSNLSKENRERAEKSIFKWYSIDYDTYEPSLVLPLLSVIADTITKEGIEKHDKPYVKGIKAVWDGTTFVNLSNQRLTEGYTIDKKLGIVKFNKPVFKVSSSGPTATTFSEPDLTLVCATEKKDNEKDDFIFWEYEIFGGQELPAVHHERSLVGYYKMSDGEIPYYAENQDELDEYAAAMLDQLADMYVEKYPVEESYPGVISIGCYGEIVSVAFSVSAENGADTIVQTGIEIPLPNLPSYKEKLSKRKIEFDFKKKQRDEDHIQKEFPDENYNYEDYPELNAAEEMSWNNKGRAIRAHNDSGSNIAAKSFVELDDYDGTNQRVEIKKPTAARLTNIAIAQEAIDNEESGIVYDSGIHVVNKDAGYSASVGDRVGCKASSHDAIEEAGGPYQVVKVDGNDLYVRPVGGGSGIEVMFGKITTNWTTGTTCTLDPCDVHGTDNGKTNATVYMQASKASYTIANSAQIDQNTICVYTKGDDGNNYLVGSPATVLTEFNINTSTYKFQTKTKDVWVLTESGESGYVDEHTGTAC